MKKHILIVNGMARCGKDTFAALLNKITMVYKCSSITAIKRIAIKCGWDGKSKTEKDRKFLSDLKELTSAYNDLAFNDIEKEVQIFKNSYLHDVMIIDIREPAEIERAKKEFGAKTVLIKNDRVPYISSNMADANVYNYTYDYVVENNGTMDEFKENIKKFYKDLLKGD